MTPVCPGTILRAMQATGFFKTFRQLAVVLALLSRALAAVAEDGADGVAQAVTPQEIETAHNDAQANRNATLFPPGMAIKSAAGSPAFYQEAFDLNCQAARNGDARAYYAMGWLYANGRGVRKDLVLATALLNKAAESGHARAREILEVMPRVSQAPVLPDCLTRQPEPPPAEEVAELGFYEKDSEIHQLVSRLAPDYGIDVGLAMAVIAVESGFNPRATSPKNAQGLMQLIPDTARRFQVRDAYDPEQNIKGGLAYLQWLMTEFEGKVDLVAAAYNAGEQVVTRYGGIPPYAETRNYVQKILALYRKSTHPYRDRLGRAVTFTTP
ncbi:MAG: lytic transglycosylase [Methylobacterium sp.]|nr:lytic transglycosylase [Methylobacterium sp.]